MNDEIERIKKILKALPEIRWIIKHREKEHYKRTWEGIKFLCEPLGLTDTAFIDYPRLDDYMVSEEYWKKRLMILKGKEVKG